MCLKRKTKTQRLNEKSVWTVKDLKYMMDNHPESFPKINPQTRDRGRNERYNNISFYDSIKQMVESLQVGDMFLNAVGTSCFIIELTNEYISYGFDRYSIFTKITKMDMYDLVKMGLIKFY
jgi:hypothetical protein